MKQKKSYRIILIAAVLIFYLFGPGCPQQALFGISCMGCGMTRAYIQFFHGNIKGAFFYHPAFWTVPIAAVLLLFHNKIPKKIRYAVLTFIFLIFFFVYIYRFCTHDPVLLFEIRKGLFYKIWNLFFSYAKVFVQKFPFRQRLLI